MGNGVFRQLGRSVEVKLLHDMRFVELHGFDRDIQDSGYFLGGFPLSHELEDFSLPGSQRAPFWE